jgi:hypothetical protein
MGSSPSSARMGSAARYPRPNLDDKHPHGPEDRFRSIDDPPYPEISGFGRKCRGEEVLTQANDLTLLAFGRFGQTVQRKVGEVPLREIGAS